MPLPTQHMSITFFIHEFMIWFNSIQVKQVERSTNRCTTSKLPFSINRVEWLWNTSDSLVDMFLWTWKCTTFKSIPIILIILTNKNVALIYSVTIWHKKTKDCAPSGSLHHKLQHHCFYTWCLPLFIISLLITTLLGTNERSTCSKSTFIKEE